MPISSSHATAAHPGASGPIALVDLGRSQAPSAVAAGVRRWRRRTSRTLVPLLILGVWQAVSALDWVSPEVLPPPTAIGSAYYELISTGELQDAIPTSLTRSLIGLLLGGTTGLVLGLFAGLWRIGEELFDAPLQMLRTVPFIALIPLFIIWFGIGEDAKIALITAATIFPMYLNTYSGVRGVEQKLIEAGRIFGLSDRGIALRIILPTALPSILVGLRYSAGVSLLALVAAEQINARSGIGYILVNANQNQRADIIIAGVIVYAVLGILLDLIMRLIERAALPWRPNLVLA